MSIEVSVALVAIAAPLTAAIVKFVPSRNGKHVTTREYDLHRTDLLLRLNGIDTEIKGLSSGIQDLTTAVNSRL